MKLEIRTSRKTLLWGIFKSTYHRSDEYIGNFSPMRLGKINIFKELSFIITKNCNLNCIYCYRKNNLKSKSSFLKLDKIKYIFKVIRHNTKVDSVQLIGGEPLIHPQIIEIISFFLNNNVKVRVSTNGTVDILKRKDFLKIVDSPLVEFRISLDSIISQENNINRGKASYEKVISNIKILRQTKSIITIKSVITTDNLHGIPKLLEFVEKNKLNYFTYGVLYNLGLANQNVYNLKYLPEYHIIDHLFYFLTRHQKYIKFLFPTLLRHMLDNLFVNNVYKFRKIWPCLDTEGDLYPQDQLVYSDFRIASISDFCNSMFSKIKKRLINFREQYEINKQTCLSCEFYPFCLRGNYGELYNIDPLLKSEFPTCNDMRKSLKYLIINHQKSIWMLKKLYSFKHI